MKPTLAQIRARWRWDRHLIKATNGNIKIAVQRTSNPYGITCHGVPYVTPFVGMKVTTSSGHFGQIITIGKFRRRDGDPAVIIKTAVGSHHLFQTALNGYKPIAPTRNRKS
jgi:hypothetical protein